MSDAVNDELVSQFMAFTGSADAGRAASYLEMSGGNLETAVGLYMEHDQGGSGGGGAAMGGGGGAMSGGGGAMSGGGRMEDDVRAPDQTRTMRLMDDNVMHSDPSFQLMNAMMEEQLAQSAFAPPSVLRDVRAAVNEAAEANQSDEQSGESKDMESEDDEDVQILPPTGPPRLSDMFAPPTHLIQAGGFQGARTMAKDTKRWLLVNIQRDEEFSSHALNRDVWRDELVENLVREGFIFWQQMDVHPEGRTYSERYQVMDYPHVGIIDPRTGRLMWRKEGWTQEKPLTAEYFAEMAMDFCSRNSFDRPPQAPRPAGAAVPARPTKRPMHEMSEDEQLQAAMRASMQDTQTDNVQEDDDGNEIEYIDDSDEDDAKPIAEEKPNSANDEFISMPIGDEPANGARIQLRMPDGKRVVRKFAGSDSVKAVYAFVAQTNDDARGGKEFVLMAGFPPSDLITSIDNTIEACSLSGQAVTVRWKQ